MTERPALFTNDHSLEAARAIVRPLLYGHLGLHRRPRVVHHHVLAPYYRIVVHLVLDADVAVDDARRQPLPPGDGLGAGIRTLDDEVVRRRLALDGGVFDVDAGGAAARPHRQDLGDAARVYRRRQLLLGWGRARRTGDVVVVADAGALDEDVLADGAHRVRRLNHLHESNTISQKGQR